MPGTGIQSIAGGPGTVDEAVLVDVHWGKVKGALDELLRSFHSDDGRDSEELEDIFEYFVQKVEFDSPLATPE